MFYNSRNKFKALILAFLVSALSSEAHAQGIVTLSEEAMFDEQDNTFNNNKVEDTALNVADKTDDELSGVIAEDKVENKDVSETSSEAVVAKATEETADKESEGQNKNSEQASEDNLFGTITEAEDSSFLLTQVDLEDESGKSVFEKMSNLEKQTTLLNLELKKEKVRNEIEALKNQRKQALEQEKIQAEELRLKNIEREKEQERKLLEEQQKLRELDLQFERERQEQLLNAYKIKMLEEKQEWISQNSNLYKKIEEGNKEKNEIFASFDKKLYNVKNKIKTIEVETEKVFGSYIKKIDNLKTQISVLKNRISAQEQELARRNPFAEGGDAKSAEIANASNVDIDATTQVVDKKLRDSYEVIEIRGQNDELIAKLKNINGLSFYVRKGSVLQSGHTVDEIASSYIKAIRDGKPEFLYFAAGGILPMELSANDENDIVEENNNHIKDNARQKENKRKKGTSFIASKTIPSLGAAMIAR